MSYTGIEGCSHGGRGARSDSDHSSSCETPQSSRAPALEWKISLGDPVFVTTGVGRSQRGRVVLHNRTNQYQKGEGEDASVYVELCRNGHRMWLSAVKLSLRKEKPLYNFRNVTVMQRDVPQNPKVGRVVTSYGGGNKSGTKKRIEKIDHIVPLTVPQRISGAKAENANYDTHAEPLTDSPFSPFQDFLRRGKTYVYRHNLNINKYKKCTSVEVDHYLCQMWRHMQEHRNQLSRTSYESEESGSDDETPAAKAKMAPHIEWCVVCGKMEGLTKCCACVVAFHEGCRYQFAASMSHRMDVDIINSVLKIAESELNPRCPLCCVAVPLRYGDIAWVKIHTYDWWPALVIPPGEMPACLMAYGEKERKGKLPVKFYGEDGQGQYAWGDVRNMCIFLPSHDAALRSPNLNLRNAFEEATTDYFRIYLK